MPELLDEPDKQAILDAATVFVREQLSHDASGHDWWHIQRVVNLTRQIAQAEGADMYVCLLAALLHDIADYKIAGDEATGLRNVQNWLQEHQVDEIACEQVIEIISTMSFAGGNRPPMQTLEGCVVQDADRLDAIGAIGIARAFAFGGSRGRALHDPGEAPQQYASKEAYHQGGGSTINHFHEKLLLLKDRMNTAYARQLAEARHRYMQTFLDEFAAEWEGTR